MMVMMMAMVRMMKMLRIYDSANGTVDCSSMTVVLRTLFHRRASIEAGISPSRELCLSV